MIVIHYYMNITDSLLVERVTKQTAFQIFPSSVINSGISLWFIINSFISNFNTPLQTIINI